MKNLIEAARAVLNGIDLTEANKGFDKKDRDYNGAMTITCQLNDEETTWVVVGKDNSGYFTMHHDDSKSLETEVDFKDLNSAVKNADKISKGKFSKQYKKDLKKLK
jgi:hypothetical protein